MVKVVSVSSSAEHRFSKQVQRRILLVTGEGVEGDAHRGATVQHLYLKRREPGQRNLAQVHLFAMEMLEELTSKGYPLTAGEIGENVLTMGLELLDLPRGALLHLGLQAIVEVTGLRTPCCKIDDLRPGLQRYLWGSRDKQGKRARRAGIMGIVRAGGGVVPGDEIGIELPPEPYVPLGPV